MAERRGGAGNGGIADQDVEPAIALVERRPEPGDALGIPQVERHERRRAAGGADRIVELFEPAHGARDRHDVGAGLRELQRQRGTDAARGAGDERDAAGEQPMIALDRMQLYHLNWLTAQWRSAMTGIGLRSAGLRWIAMGSVAVTALIPDAVRASGVETFYKGRSISLIIGFSAGSGYDIYARLLARYIGRHIPGNPSIIPQNMPGGGSLKAANYMYSVAAKDGSVIATISRSLPVEPLLGDVAVRRAQVHLDRQHRQQCEPLRDLAHHRHQDLAGRADQAVRARDAGRRHRSAYFRAHPQERVRREGARSCRAIPAAAR